MQKAFGNIVLCEWNDDFKMLSELLADDGAEELLVCAYSWGCGNGLRELSKHFTGQIKAILCDPVYRSRFPWMRWRALTNKFFEPTIKYLDNVTVVRWFNQTLNKPSGHRVQAGEIIPEQPTTLNADHGSIDDTYIYHQSCLTAAKVFLRARTTETDSH